MLIVLKSPSGTLSGLSVLTSGVMKSKLVSPCDSKKFIDLTSSLFSEKRHSFANAEFLIIYGKY